MKMIPRNNSFKKLNRPLDNQGGMRKKQKEHTKAQNEKSSIGTDSKTGLEAPSSRVFEILHEMDDVLGEYQLVKPISVCFLHSTPSH